ncbi:MAG: isoprenylcysteine carboxylmethyltransferase family protein [Verrucomicrobia bacterium]|nr:isoprenylcysteine carboxylmethyltransferase family protein [Verrucomicrobiota bacterium]
MKTSGTRPLAIASVGLGGGSLVLFGYFLLFGPPFPFAIADSDPKRLAFDAFLCLVFFTQHSAMIRRGAKDYLAKRVSEARVPAFYSLASGVCLLALVLAWQPTTRFVFHLPTPARWLSGSLALLAVAGFVWGAHSLRGFDVFGTQRLQADLRAMSAPPAVFVVRGPYRYVRHPLYLFMLLLIWSTPRLPYDQLLFNVLWTVWIIIGTKLEERDLLADFGPAYRQYQASVPMLMPSPRAVLRRQRPSFDS